MSAGRKTMWKGQYLEDLSREELYEAVNYIIENYANQEEEMKLKAQVKEYREALQGRPLYQVSEIIREWLREIHSLDVYVEPVVIQENPRVVQYAAWVPYTQEEEKSGFKDQEPECYDTYNEALKSAIMGALDVLEKRGV